MKYICEICRSKDVYIRVTFNNYRKMILCDKCISNQTKPFIQMQDLDTENLQVQFEKL